MEECDGKLEVDAASGFPQAEGRAGCLGSPAQSVQSKWQHACATTCFKKRHKAQLSIAGGHDVQLTLRLVPPGEAGSEWKVERVVLPNAMDQQ